MNHPQSTLKITGSYCVVANIDQLLFRGSEGITIDSLNFPGLVKPFGDVEHRIVDSREHKVFLSVCVEEGELVVVDIEVKGRVEFPLELLDLVRQAGGIQALLSDLIQIHS